MKIRNLLVSLALSSVGCGGAPFTTEPDGVGSEPLTALDAGTPDAASTPPAKGPETSTPDSGPPATPEATTGLPEGGAVETGPEASSAPALCSGTCTPSSDAGAFPYVRCAGQCTGNCYGVCHIQTVPDQMVAGTPCVPGVCDGYCDAECILKGGASVACDGTCG